jgi:arabinose-5-phosphate isomerase
LSIATLIPESELNIAKNIKTIARDVLLNESRAIENLVNYLDNNFEDCVNEIYSSKGRVVITDNGKSAIIANKIVATLNSTGTTSVFVLSADAIHGDLRIVQREDIAICISKCGNTPKVNVLVPLLKRWGSKLVALVTNTNTYLTLQANYSVNALPSLNRRNYDEGRHRNPILKSKHNLLPK